MLVFGATFLFVCLGVSCIMCTIDAWIINSKQRVDSTKYVNERKKWDL
jgi:hypothetical protein